MSENETPIEDQDDNAGEAAAESAEGATEATEDATDGPETAPDPADDAPIPDDASTVSDAMAEARPDDSEPDPAEDERLEPTSEELDAEFDTLETGLKTLAAAGAEATADTGLPTYKCHKKVRAFLIASATSLSNGRVELRGIDPAHVVIVEADYIDKHHPQIGGYYVRYHDGYQSWSPADAFEGGYTLVAD